MLFEKVWELLLSNPLLAFFLLVFLVDGLYVFQKFLFINGKMDRLSGLECEEE